MVDRILKYISIFLALLVVLPLHEFAHGFAAVKCGDLTPKINKRYTINPFAHFDVYGLISFVLVGFGWAKPMPINPNNFKNYKRGAFFTSIAGVTANLLLAFFVYPLAILSLFVPQFGYFTLVLQQTLFYIISLSLAFFIFNLIPVYPLDGFRIVDVFSKKRSKLYWFLRNQGIYVLYFLIILSLFADLTGIWQIDLLGLTIGRLSAYVEIPIALFWGMFF